MTYLSFGIVVALLGIVLTRSVVAAVLGGLVAAAIAFAGMPVLAWGFGGAWLVVAMGLLVTGLLAGMGGNSTGAALATMGGGVGLTVVLFVVSLLTSHPLFHDTQFRNLIGTVATADFSTEATLLDQSQIRIVTKTIADRRAHELLGADAGLGSRVDIGTMTIQSVNGELIWVAPLEHKDFWKWNNNETTPGYVVVNANNIADARMVEKLDGSPIKMKIGLEGYFSGNLYRYLYTNGYASVGLTDPTFELDDAGRPYWVVTRYAKKVGFEGRDATGVIVVDPQTGEIRDYDIDAAPAWIDRIQPAEFVAEQIDDWGELIHGWGWNNWSGRDKMTSTPGIALVYAADGRPYWYTGVKSVGSNAEGTTGFMLVDSRTKKATFYHQAGATEEAAKHAIEGKISNMAGWYASWPILYLIDGQATYVSTIMDKNGNYKGIGIANVANRAIVVAGDDLRDALRRYSVELRNSGMRVAPGAVSHDVTLEGRLLRSGVEVIDGSTQYYLLLEGHADRIIVVNAKVSPEVPLMQAGDRIRVTINDTHDGIAAAVKFDDLEVAVTKSPEQEKVEQRHDAVQEQQQVQQDNRNADAAWQKLTPEQKRALLKAQ